MILAALADWSAVRSSVIAEVAIALVLSVGWLKVLHRVGTAGCGLCFGLARLRKDVQQVGVENAVLLDQNRLLLDKHGIAYCYTDAAGKVLDVSEAWIDLSGCPKDEALAGLWTKYLEPKDQQPVTSQFFANAKSASPVAYTVDFQFTKSRAVIRATIEPLMRGDQVVGFRGINRVLYPDPLTDQRQDHS